MNNIKLVGSWRALGDTGREYTIAEFQEFITTDPVGRPISPVAGAKWLVTGLGDPVRTLPDGALQIFATGETVRRIPD